MNTLSRRNFLSLSSVSVAVAAAVAAIPGATIILRQPRVPAAWDPTPNLDAPLIAHVRDLESGEISVLVGTREVVHKDVDLARRLYAVARRSN